MSLVVDFQSIHSVAYRIRTRHPEKDWRTVHTGTHDDDMVPRTLPPLPVGTLVEYRFLYTDSADEPFVAMITATQEEDLVEGGRVQVEGEGGEWGVDQLLEVVEES
ncbi:MAG: hypothetical protein GWM92_08410 [Gemmatimonadetes bacterium]|nr:hypothetical protein [Gemmatimonadota bacterium]NIT87293.1 hypothetical protein [Gemmatimonadota bacterium]NIU31137.1 hypothetical protein [Gemmatimonadota bacterium]NIU35863.1 hypothetical protein [Gemmatimonadota bacterium]NIV61497.1 hypothetical protein [Gemmatimonadota bacterium]